MHVRYRPQARSQPLLPVLCTATWPGLLACLAVAFSALIIPPAAATMSTAAGPGAAPVRPQAGKAVPAAALASVSRALGRDDLAYHAAATARGLTAANPRQRLRAQFTSGGVRIRSGPLVAGLGLRGIGFGDRLAAVRQVRPGAAGNLVSFWYGPVREWYADGPGLEQGFTLTGPPSGRAGGPLTLAMTMSGNARAALVPGHAGVVFSRAGSSLAYRGLVASDALGRHLPAWLGLRGRQLLLHIQAAWGTVSADRGPSDRAGSADRQRRSRR